MKKTLAIIGGGAAALSLGAFLNKEKYAVTIYEKNKSLGRKFLVAGKGGFNLSHSESMDMLIDRYNSADFCEEYLRHFTNEGFVNWLGKIGVPTYVGSSKRIFPEKGIKPIDVLNKMMDVLDGNDVKICFEHEWEGWSEDGEIMFKNKDNATADVNVFAMGGGSWKVTGSDGTWLPFFEQKGIAVNKFEASNCAVGIDWSDDILTKYEGLPLKNIAVTCDGVQHIGEAMITKFGMEGSTIYALALQLRSMLAETGKAFVCLDLKPVLSRDELIKKIQRSGQKNITEILRNKLKLSPASIGLLKHFLSKEEYTDHQLLADNIKSLKIEVRGLAALDEAISTVGGIATEAVDKHFQLKKMKDHYCIGEMLDWDAPTGGYLLQGCFSMGAYLANHLNGLD